MGQEMSSPFDPSIPPKVLARRDLKAVAEYIKSGKCKRIVFMVGAGVSTAAGIPDFRSPKTGLYSNLARLDLPYPEAVFDISYFRENPKPFYLLAQELWPGKYQPTLTHIFMRLVHKHGLLERVFTQNIDTLELAAGIPREKCIFAHGSFATQRCIDCKADFPREKLEEAVSKADPELARCEACGGLVKPDIVFFGEALPNEFHENRMLPAQADLAFIIGSSLSVHPFASLPQCVEEETPRVLLNMEQAGGIGSRREDVVWLGPCDKGVGKLARELGWEEEMMEMWRSYPRDEEKPLDVELNDDNLESEVEKLTQEVDKGLQVSDAHKKYIEANLQKKQDIWNVKRTEGEKSEEGASGLGASNGGTNGESKA